MDVSAVCSFGNNRVWQLASSFNVPLFPVIELHLFPISEVPSLSIWKIIIIDIIIIIILTRYIYPVGKLQTSAELEKAISSQSSNAAGVKFGSLLFEVEIDDLLGNDCNIGTSTGLEAISSEISGPVKILNRQARENSASNSADRRPAALWYVSENCPILDYAHSLDQALTYSLPELPKNLDYSW